MRKAWIENDRIRDICPGDPAELYHPDVAAFYTTDVPDDAANGDGWVDGQLVKPEPPVLVEPAAQEPEPAALPVLSPVEFKMCFTSAERIAIKAARTSDPVLEDAYDLLDDPRLTGVDLNLASVQELIGYMVSQGLLSSERRGQILAGKML